jgi:hypothetical protein
LSNFNKIIFKRLNQLLNNNLEKLDSLKIELKKTLFPPLTSWGIARSIFMTESYVLAAFSSSGRSVVAMTPHTPHTTNTTD